MRLRTRRVFLRDGAVAVLAVGLPPAFLSRSLLGASRGGARRKTLVCVFQRGAVDGLNMVVPFGERQYFATRQSIAVSAPGRGEDSALDLDGFFGLHPSLSAISPLYQRGELAIVHAVGSSHPTRSHFEAQDFMETGTPGDKRTRSGWLNRVLTASPCDCEGRTLQDSTAHATAHAIGQAGMGTLESLRGVAVGGEMPVSLRGPAPAFAIPDLETFGVARGRNPDLESTFARLYREESGDVLASAADGSFGAVRLLREADPLSYRPAGGVEYPPGDFGRSMSQIAQLIKADVGLEVAFADIGGWDTHVGQGGVRGQLANRLRTFGDALGAFCVDLGDRMEDVVLLTMSEFGRTVAENGSGGTDHGHANCMLLFGGSVRGGRVHGEWPGLERDQLWEGRDLAVTTDFRAVLSEVVRGHLGTRDLDTVFPGFAGPQARYQSLLG